MAQATLTFEISDSAAQRVGLTNMAAGAQGSDLAKQLVAGVMTLMEQVIVATTPAWEPIGADAGRRAHMALDESESVSIYAVAALDAPLPAKAPATVVPPPPENASS